MNIEESFKKEDLLKAFDLYFDGLRRFLYYKTGDIDLSEDIAQDVFLKVWEKRDMIKKSTVKSLLFTMGNNLLIDYYRNKTTTNKHRSQLQTSLQTENQSPHFLMEEKEFEDKLNTVLKMIPNGQREVFLMSRIDGLKYEEISTRLGLSIKAVEKRISKAMMIIKENLGIKI